MPPDCRSVRAVSDHLLVERRGFVEILTINRPDRMNTISGPMLGALSKALVAADHDSAVRAIVITGAGRAFCAGLDLQDMSSGKGLGDGSGAGRAGELDLRDT